MKRSNLIALGALAFACAEDERARFFVVDEHIELCPAAAGSPEPLENVKATQWRFSIDAIDLELPPSRAVPNGLVAHGTPVEPFMDLRDANESTPIDDVESEIALFENAEPFFPGDSERDLLYAWRSGTSPLADAPLRLSLWIEAPHGADFSLAPGPDSARTVHVGCIDDVGPCTNRMFETCDPEGPTTRTRVSLDRGEMVLDVRRVERDAGDGDLDRVMFVAAEVRIDGVEVLVQDIFGLLHAASSSVVGDGSYAVLHPDFDVAGLGCGIAVEDIGGDRTPRAFTVDCDVQQREPLEVVAIARESLP